MATTPETSGTSLEVVGPYLPYDLELADARYPFLRHRIERVHLGEDGLRLDTTRIDSLLDSEADGEGTVGFDEVLPLLRPFSALTTPLPDGTVPALSLGQMIMRRISPAALIVECKMLLSGNIRLYDSEGDGRITIYSDWTLGNCGSPAEYDWLRSKHFALPVNGRPLAEGVDYITKEPSPASLTKQEGAESHE